MTERQIKISSYDVYPNSLAKPSALQRYMQQTAREDCDQAGCTCRFMRERNTVFVITKLGLEIYRPPEEGETITIKTYNDSITGITFDREFEFFSGGDLIARCSSLWVLVKYDDRTLVRPRSFGFDFECAGIHGAPAVELPRAISSEGLIKCGEREVRLSDLDENDHLNNCVYPDIALDSVDGFDGKSSFVSSATVIFRHEARRGDILEVSSSPLENGICRVFARDITSGNPCFESAFGFKSV